jgi:hypothetical protein
MNEDELKYIKENYFQPELDLKLLMEMLEEVEGEPAEPETPKFSAARFYKTALKSFNAPTEQAGELGTEERQNFQKYITRNVRGTTLAEKIASINAIVAGGQQSKDPKISEIMGTLGAVKMLQQTLDDFNESTAGFLFEAFLSGLLQGVQVTDRVGGTLPIEDCMFFVDPKTGEGGQPVSLKLLSPATQIHGSLENLLGFFQRPDIAAVAEQKGIEYIVATKTPKNELDIYSFNIKPSNFFYWIEEHNFDFSRLGKMLEEQLLKEQKTPEEVEMSRKKWERFFLQRAPMFGLDPKEVNFNYEWGSASGDWRTVVKKPRTARAARDAVAEVILSPVAKTKFERWKRSKLLIPSNTVHLESAVTKDSEGREIVIPMADLEDQFRVGDEETKQNAAGHLAIIGRKRLSAYFDSIEHVGEKVDEAAIHVQRWWAVNKKGEQPIRAGAVASVQSMLQPAGAEVPATPEDIIRWAETLTGLLTTKQFHIKPVRVRSEGTIYGTINVDKRKIYRSLQQYSRQLEDLCAPLYEELENLSKFINGYFLQNRVGDAFRAQTTAQRMAQHTDKLAEKAEK